MPQVCEGLLHSVLHRLHSMYVRKGGLVMLFSAGVLALLLRGSALYECSAGRGEEVDKVSHGCFSKTLKSGASTEASGPVPPCMEERLYTFCTHLWHLEQCCQALQQCTDWLTTLPYS